MVTPYIVFYKQCEEALNFYEKVLNGKNKEIIRYNDYAPEGIKEDISNYLLHARMEIYNTIFTFADEFSKPVIDGNMVHLTINPSSLEDGNRIYNELKENGEVLLTPTETFYSLMHTIVKDKFGVLWNIIVINN